MRELALAGLVAVVFGLGSFYATDNFGAFSGVNLALGGLALGTALVARARRMRFVGGPHSRPVLLRGLAWIALALALAIGVERAASRSALKWDWTLEQRFELSPATRGVLADLEEPVRVLLFRDAYDPRARRTRLLLQELAAAGDAPFEERLLDEHPDEEERFEVGTSNTVVLVMGTRFETVERPTEGTLFEALSRLRSAQAGTLVFLRGDGQGDVGKDGETDFSGLAVALATEGFTLRSVPSAHMSEVPEGTDAVVLIAPRRPLLPRSIDALRSYLERGGSLVAMLEPGVDTGVEALLAEYGLESPDKLVVDPASGDVGRNGAGLDILAFNYESHPVTRGLDRNRMTFFPGARAFRPRKPEPTDRVQRLVLSSSRAWLSPDLSLLESRDAVATPPDVREDYQPIVAAGHYARSRGEPRIVAFGDSDFASNRYLRALYNLDVVVNAVHWAVQRESAITLRPKIRTTVQFPLPLTDTLRTLYGVGLLVPELLLIAGGVVWLRRRSA